MLSFLKHKLQYVRQVAKYEEIEESKSKYLKMGQPYRQAHDISMYFRDFYWQELRKHWEKTDKKCPPSSSAASSTEENEDNFDPLASSEEEMISGDDDDDGHRYKIKSFSTGLFKT